MRSNIKKMIIIIWFVVGIACRQQMADQPAYRPLAPSEFFANGTSAQNPLPYTVAQDEAQNDQLLTTGISPDPSENRADLSIDLNADRQNETAPPNSASISNDGLKMHGLHADLFPFPITRAEIEKGQERFNIYCAPCHDRTGTGHGIIVARGYPQPPSFHIDRLRRDPVGHFFQVITEGFGAMPSYAAQVTPRERWDIAAYIRALQLSRTANFSDLSATEQQQLSKSEAQK